MTDELLLTNARIVTPDRVVDGTLRLAGGRIAEVAEGATAAPGALDLEGDVLIPGLVELHTDALERHLQPRPGTDWPVAEAVVAHDAQILASGITTVLDAVALGDIVVDGARVQRLQPVLEGLAEARRLGVMKADHLLHLRCEISFPGLPALLEAAVADPAVRLISVMDHTPGQRQFVSLETYATYYQGKYGLSDAAFAAFVAQRRLEQERYAAAHRRLVVETARRRGIALASHDDATPAHVAEAVADGMALAEFPTTVEAAEGSRAGGLAVMMGAPNLVRGGSHSGNVSARELAARGLLDIVSSDYVPASLLQSAFLLAGPLALMTLPQAVAAVTSAPARAAGLADRGAIEPGLRADLLRVRRHGTLATVEAVWREGRRVG